MKLRNIHVREFISLLEHAKGNIRLVMGDGNTFSLSSKLAQLYCIKLLLSNNGGSHISPELIFDSREDEVLFSPYSHTAA